KLSFGWRRRSTSSWVERRGEQTNYDFPGTEAHDPSPNELKHRETLRMPTYRHSPREFIRAADQALEAAEKALTAMIAEPQNDSRPEAQARKTNAFRDVKTARVMLEAALDRLPRTTLNSAGPVARRPDIGTPSQRIPKKLRTETLRQDSTGNLPQVTEL